MLNITTKQAEDGRVLYLYWFSVNWRFAFGAFACVQGPRDSLIML